MRNAFTAGLLLLAVTSCQAKTLYLSSNGNDAADGLTPKTAWHTLSRLEMGLRSGDTAILEAGSRFEGSLVLRPDGQKGSVTIRSLGGPATIVCSKGAAISVQRGDVILENLEIVSMESGKDPKNIGIHLDSSEDKTLKHVRIQNVKIQDFGADGIAIDAQAHGFEEVVISHVIIDHCFGSGLGSNDAVAYKGLGYAHRNFHIVDCEFTRNGSGSGIVLAGVDGALVEFCRAADNDRGNGGLGMWAWSARKVTFRYCISSGTRSQRSDGGGFDLDGGCQECLVESCLSFNNDGCGYMHCDYPYSPPTRQNIIRNSVSIDDGARKSAPQSAGFGFVTWGSGLDDCVIEHNVAYVSPDFPTKVDGGALFVAYVPDLKTNGDKAHIRNCLFKMNLVDAEKGAAIGDNLPKANRDNVRFEDNSYRAPSLIAVEDGIRYPTIADWLHSPDHPNDEAGPGPSLSSKLSGYKDVRPRQLPSFLAHVAH